MLVEEMRMKAIICTQYGAPDVLQLQEVQTPTPQDHEVLVKIHVATATTAGLSARTGKPLVARLFSGLTKPKPANRILGVEFAGEVAAIGKDVTLFNVGDAVFGMTGAKTPGAYAEYNCVPEDVPMLIKPENISAAESAAVVEGGLTAINFLHHNANIRADQQVLIYGASGSVGTAAVQIAKQADATVTAVCSAASFDLVRPLGADYLIDYRTEDFTNNGQKYDIIFDTVGKRSFAQCKGSLTENGTFLDAGNPTTILAMLWTRLFSKKKAILAASYVRTNSAIKQDLATLKDLIESGQMQAVIDRTYPLAQTADAHIYVETGRKKGNVVIQVT